jgi:transitional endoplasmic reticulum ATPase
MSETSPTLTMRDARPQDVGRHIARIDPADIQQLGLVVGGFACLQYGAQSVTLRVMPAFPGERGKRLVQIDAATRQLLHANLGDRATLRAVECAPAKEVWLRIDDGLPMSSSAQDFLANWVDGLALSVGMVLRPEIGGQVRRIVVERLRPDGPCVALPETQLKIDVPQARSTRKEVTLFDDIGGLEREIESLRQIVELPLKSPQMFASLGIAAPRGVLLYGPPGTGKTLIARAVASESRANFIAISAPEIVHKFYGESEAKLRELFERARKQAPAIVFIDEIDAIAARRDQVQGEVEKRIVAQLLTLLDGLDGRGQIIVIGATNLPQVLDPALRRPGRFDRELLISLPSESARRSILRVHTRSMPLAADVDLDEISRETRGYSGADLKALCQEAGMRIATQAAREPGTELVVNRAAFESALLDVVPTSMRQVDIEVPNTPLDTIGGLREAKRMLCENILWPIETPELYRHFKVNPARGLVLHGPPGTGKTLLARAIASAAKANFLAVSGPSLLSRYVGDSERAVRELFARARQATPSIIFFDEFDSLAPARGRNGSSEVSERVVAQLLTEIDGLTPRAPVWLLAATNRVDLIDPALLRPGRFDALVPVNLPDADDCLAILRVALRERPLESGLDISTLAPLCVGLSGAQIVARVDDAALRAIRRTRESPGADMGISLTDFRTVFEDALGRAPS